ncbi:hypothetical protein [Paludibacterium yongneupense]|uniref:hypothetical protein n=1 Tax=Paludibacterium yongneupense TaxID=400061 RepID=UPI000424A7AC|nr:hypothetical protein [Paludibacterium yongneupense]
MKLTLYVPGLAWLDEYDGAEVCQGLALPALSRLLGAARRDAAPEWPSRALARQFATDSLACAGEAAAQAALPAAAAWLFADPVHVRIERDRALLADVGVMALDLDDARGLAEALDRHFAADGLRFFVPQPGRWLLALDAPPDATFSPLMDTVGDSMQEHLPRGGGALQWSAVLNEIQMLLYTHPINDAREARGQLPVNSLWLWGDQAAPTPRAPAARVLSDQASTLDLARRGGCQTDTVPYTLQGLPAGPDSLWVELDRLRAAAHYRDAWGWREALQALEEDWFRPLLDAISSGRIEQLDLCSYGRAGFDARVTRRDLWKFWRRPLALPALYSHA